MSTSAPAQPPPAAPTTLAAQPPGTTFTLATHNGLEAFKITQSLDRIVMVGTYIGDATAQVITTATGFTLTLPNGDQATFDTSAASTQRIAPNVYSTAIAAGQKSVAFTQGSVLTYSTFGTWLETTGAGLQATVTSGGSIAYGISTQQMPTNGSATFTGSAAGRYFDNLGSHQSSAFTSNTAKLVADFATGTVAGGITNILVQGSNARMSDLFMTSGMVAGTHVSGAVIAGTNAVDRHIDFSGLTGSFQGQFDGPSAAEASGTFVLNDATGVRLAGAFALTGQVTPPGQPAPRAPAIDDPLVALAAASVGTLFTPTYVDMRQILVPAGGYSNAVLGIQITQTVNGPSFQLANDVQAVTLAPANLGASGYYSSPSTSPAGTMHLATTSLTYASYGIWAVSDSSAASLPGVDLSTHHIGAFAYGVLTPVNQVPITGAATYSGSFGGVFTTDAGPGAITGGAVTLTADFAASTIGGSITGITGVRANGSPGSTERFNDVSLASTAFAAQGASSVTFSGTGTARATPSATIDIAGANAEFAGRFYGPNAAEVAGVMSFGKGTTAVLGAFAAKK